MYLSESPFGWSQHNVMAQYNLGDPLQTVNNVANDIVVTNNPERIYFRGLDNRAWVIYPTEEGNTLVRPVREDINYVTHSLKSMSNVEGGKLAFIGPHKKIRKMTWGSCENLNPPHQFSTLRNDVNIDEPTEKITTEGYLLYPNPTNRQITIIKNKSNKDEVIIVHLYDISGKRVKTFNNISTREPIDISYLSRGAYIVEVFGKDDVGRLKFIKI